MANQRTPGHRPEPASAWPGDGGGTPPGTGNATQDADFREISAFTASFPAGVATEPQTSFPSKGTVSGSFADGDYP